MRRLSTAAAATTAAPTRSRLPLLRFLQKQPIEELTELKTIQTVERIAEKIPANPALCQLEENNECRQWIESYRNTNSISAQSQLDKDGFDAFMKAATVYLREKEVEAFEGREKIGVMEESELKSPEAEAYVEAIKLKLARHMCAQAGNCFAQLDKDSDGKVQVEEVEQLLQVAAGGNSPEWLKSQFHLYDADGDGVVTETESKLILDSMIDTQKAAMTEIFAGHVDNLPRKHEKLFAKSMSEEDWKSKIPEKVRCVFHFATKLDEERETFDWELFKNSQQAEFPELSNLLAVYAKGFYDERYTFHERKQERRSTRRKGLMLAAAIAVVDVIAAVV